MSLLGVTHQLGNWWIREKLLFFSEADSIKPKSSDFVKFSIQVLKAQNSGKWSQTAKMEMIGGDIGGYLWDILGR